MSLFLLNAYIARELFTIEYTRHMGSIEGLFIAISRYITTNFPDLTWCPLWYGGIPFQNAYSPGLPLVVAAVAWVARLSPALSYHAVTAAFYCLGPVTLFWMAFRLSGSSLYSGISALVYSIFSASTVLIPAVRNDVGSVFNARRLDALVRYGEGPHIAALALLPIAIVCLDTALQKRKPIYYFLAALAFAVVSLTNWLGAFALAAAVCCYWLSRQSGAIKIAGVALYAYVLACSWIPPSTLQTIRTNEQQIGWPHPFSIASWEYAGLVLAGVIIFLKLSVRFHLNPILRFSILFSLVMGAITLGWEWWRISLMPQPSRYHLEMEMGLALASVFAIRPLLDRLGPRPKIVLACGFLVICLWQVRHYRQFARSLAEPIEITSTTEYKEAVWFDRNMNEARVMAPGSVSFFLNVFTDTPQLAGSAYQGITNPLIPAMHFQVLSGMNAGAREGEVAIAWLKAFGVHAVGIGGPKSGEYYKPFANPRKFAGLLPELWRDGDDVIYGIPQASSSLAHVVREEDMVTRAPEGGLDVEPLKPYLAALDDPRLPRAEFTWHNRHSATVEADLHNDQLLSIQMNWHPGWSSRVNGIPRPLFADKLGLVAVQPGCEGRCTVELSYNGGLEMLVMRALSWTGILAGLVWSLGSMARLRAVRPQ